MKKKIINGLLMMALVVATTSSFVSCQDTVGDDYARLDEQNTVLKTILLQKIQYLEADLSKIKNLDEGGYLGEVKFTAEYEDLLKILRDATSGVPMPSTGTGVGTTQSLADWIAAVNSMLAELYGQSGSTVGKLQDIINRLIALEAQSHEKVDLTDVLSRLSALEGQLPVDLSDIIARLQALEGQTPGTVFDPSEIIAQLTALQNQVNPMATQVSGLVTDVAGLQNAMATAQNGVNDNAAAILALTNTVNDLNQAITNQLTQINTRLETLEGKFDNYYTKEQVDAIKDEIVAKFGKYYTKEEMDVLLKNIDDKFAGYYTKAEVDQFITEVKNMFKDYYTIDQINNLVNTINEKFANYYTKEEIDAMKTAVEGRIKDLEDHKIVVDEKLDKLTTDLATANEKIAAAEAEIEAIKTTYATKVALKDSVNKLRAEIAEAQAAAQQYAQSLVDALRTELTTEIDGLKTTVGEMQSAISTLQTDVADLKTRMETVEGKVATLEEKVDALEKKVDKIFKAQALQVTGIIVQGAYSPVFGIGKLPVGVQTNVLAAYVGRTYNDVTFPAFESTNYVNEGDCFTAEEAAVIAGVQPEDIKAGIVLRDADDNAGTLYLTVNPNTVDFTGKLITLENSQGTAAPVTLSPLEKSNYRLNMGWTRAADNGFYEAKAKISQNDLAKAQARVDVEQLKTVAKDLYKNHNKKSINEAASALYTTLSDVTDAQAAKATYTGLDENGNEQEKSVFSEYGLAVTAITPLSYNTLKNWHPTRIPGFNIAEKFINKLFDNINIKIDLGTKGVHVPTISHIDIKKFDELSDKWTVKVTIPSVTVNSDPVKVNIDVNGDVYFVEHWDDVKNEPKVNPSTGEKYKADGHLTINQSLAPITVNAKTNEITVYPDIKEQLRLVYNAFAEPLSDVNTTLDNLQDFVDQLNNVLESVNNLDKKIADAKNDARDKVISYLNKIEQKILSKASYVNQALQPVLLVQSGNGYKLLSKMEKYPSVAPETTLSLYATSYNIELLTPAYKKYAVCTGAWKADGTFDAEEAKAVNAAGYENFGKVIDGTEHKVTFTGKAGYKYRIVFQALDYHGKIASMRYYVQF